MDLKAPPHRSPIAIVGMGCRMPQADGIDAFWELLERGIDAISEVPPERWDADALWSDDARTPGKTYARWGGYIPDGDCFDAEFFGITYAEAISMDPQQGLILETAWHALEDAGIAVDSLRGSNVGVFVGISNSDFDRRLCSDFSNLTLLAGTGTSYSIVANRLSYAFGLCGPSIAVDLACSSSLVAIHLACQSLALQECELALAGGVHLILSPEKTITFSRGKVLARDGRCKSFADNADGYVRGDGCGVLVLKRLDDAIRDRDSIAAVIRGSAINHNGASNGLSAPLGVAQERVIRSALACGGIDGATIDYVEAHSPGTSLGDTIEARALVRALIPGRGAEDRCVFGSVKSNIGHLEAAAGIASVIKTVLALEHKWIPATLHANKLNSKLPLENSVFSIAQHAQPWLSMNHPRRAGVSSFSFGGANAHVVIEESPLPSGEPSNRSTVLQVLPISARSEDDLQHLIVRYALYCEQLSAGDNAADAFANLCYTAACGRTHLNCRIAIVAADAREAARSLREFTQHGSARGVWYRAAKIVRLPVIEIVIATPASVETEPQWSSAMASAYLQLRAFAAAQFPQSAEAENCDTNFAASFAALSLLRYCGVQPTRVLTVPQCQLLAQRLTEQHTTHLVCELLKDRIEYWNKSVVIGHEETSALAATDQLTAGNRDARKLVIVFGETDTTIDRWLLSNIAAAYVAGVSVRWEIVTDKNCRKLRLPTYLFRRERYWPNSLNALARRQDVAVTQ